MTDLESVRQSMLLAKTAGKARFDADMRAVNILIDHADVAEDPAVSIALLRAAREIIAREHP